MNEQILLKKKMNKKSLREFNNSKRIRVDWNTGTRVFQAGSDYDRKAFKKETRKILSEI